MGQAKIGEWFWRFLAIVMLFAVAWTFWIFNQLNPTPLVTLAAFEAAAKAKANAGQSTQGVIVPATDPAAATTPVAAAETPQESKEPKEPKEPPINADKLKFSDSLTEKK